MAQVLFWMWKERFPVVEKNHVSMISFLTFLSIRQRVLSSRLRGYPSSPIVSFPTTVRSISSRSDSSSLLDRNVFCICTGLKVLTASSAERVRLVVTLTKAGGTLRYSTLSVLSSRFIDRCQIDDASVGISTYSF